MQARRLRNDGAVSLEPTWHNLPDFLAEEFPELRAEIEASYLEWLSVYANPYPHVFLEEFLGPMLIGTGELTEPAA